MTEAVTLPPPRPGGRAVWPVGAAVLLLAGGKIVIHVATNLLGAYGYIRDELYYLACSDRLAWGYVDHPPLSIAALRVSRALFGDSLVAIRILPALSGAAVMVLAAMLARELGGRRYAPVLACGCTLSAPLLLGMDGLFSMNSFDVLLWTAAIHVFVVASRTGRERHWVGLGLVLGLGLLNKLSVLWLIAGLVVGLSITSHRAVLFTRRAGLAAVACLVVFLPHVAWQIANGSPTLEFIRNAGFGKYSPLSPAALLGQQAMFMNPITFPLWAGGTVYVLLSPAMRRFRMLPIAYLAVFAILTANGHSKATYLAPLLPMLFVFGAVAFERLIDRVRWHGAGVAVVVLMLATGAALAPTVLPVLPVETYLRYARAIGLAPWTSEMNALGRLPQHYADMFGWPEMVERIGAAYSSLEPDERPRCAIFCRNYGEAGAVDFFGRRYGLPMAISGHNNYWLWGPRGASGDTVLEVGGSRASLERTYRHVVQAGLIVNRYSMPYESDLPIWICRGRRTTFAEDWQALKIFN